MILRTFLTTVLLASLLFGCGGSDPEFLDGRAAEMVVNVLEEMENLSLFIQAEPKT